MKKPDKKEAKFPDKKMTPMAMMKMMPKMPKMKKK